MPQWNQEMFIRCWEKLRTQTWKKLVSVLLKDTNSCAPLTTLLHWPISRWVTVSPTSTKAQVCMLPVSDYRAHCWMNIFQNLGGLRIWSHTSCLVPKIQMQAARLLLIRAEINTIIHQAALPASYPGPRMLPRAFHMSSAAFFSGWFFCELVNVMYELTSSSLDRSMTAFLDSLVLNRLYAIKPTIYLSRGTILHPV